MVGTTAVADACAASGVSRFTYVSSAEVYGQSDAAVTEREPKAPRSPYGVAKAGAEAMLEVLAPTLDLSVCIVRPFSVYGPGARPNSLMASVIAQALTNERIRLFDPEPVRDYVYVDDVAAALLCSVEYDLPAGTVEAFNVGSGIGVSVGDVAATVLAEAGRDGATVEWTGSDRPRTSAVSRLVADTSAATERLSWRATTPLATGVRITIESARRSP